MDPNFWRGFVFTQAVLVFVMTAAVVVRYGIALAHVKTRDRVLPLHIVCISLSYLLATVFIGYELWLYWDAPMTYRVPFAAAIFVLGDAGLIFMLVHISVQRKFIGKVRAHVTAETEREKTELAAELKQQTSGLATMIMEVGAKADQAYHEANAVNSKIATLHEEIQEGQTDTSEKIDKIEETGTDTNVRVRKIVPLTEATE